MKPRFSLCALALTLPLAAAQQPAFPGAEGFGAYAKGGRGGDVYYVTNLNDSGPGSLREGILTATGPRTIVFGLSGTIVLKSSLRIDKPNLTIAGQTAPGDGITLRDNALKISADNTIVRYLRSRLGDMGSEGDAVSVGGKCANVIVDHCSAGWGIDEVFSVTGEETDLVTVQWCMITESLYNSIHHKGPHGMGGILGGRRTTAHHNLYAHHNSRNPKIPPRLSPQIDFRNNVIYNWGSESNYDGSFSHVNWVNNYYKPGPGTKAHVFTLSFASIITKASASTSESATSMRCFSSRGITSPVFLISPRTTGPAASTLGRNRASTLRTPGRGCRSIIPV